MKIRRRWFGLKILRGQKGQGTLMFVTVVCAIGTIFIFNSTSTFKRDQDQKTRDFDQVLLNEMTTSAFSVMESALSRRLWEPPPDANCMKSKNFAVNGGLPNGILWSVTAKYNSLTKNFEFTSVGKYKSLTATYLKRVKVLDVSDYLLFSENPSGVAMARAYNPKSPVGLIARDRRVYIKGPLHFDGVLYRPNPNMNWGGSPAGWPGEFGTLVQGDRLQFTGGIYFDPQGVSEPNPSSTNIRSLLAPYSSPWGSPARYLAQRGAGYAILSPDYNLIQQLSDQVKTGASGPLSLSSIRSQIYPTALFGGSPPLQAWTATDNGSYFSNPDQDSIFTYNYAQGNNFGERINATCFSKSDAFATKQYCSHSEHFPKGFASWRKNAHLEGVLFTADSEVVPSPSLNWDNFKALEEDAQQCGLVVDAPNGQSYEDCAIWDGLFMRQYAATGNATCDRISSLDMDHLTLTNFNPSLLADPANKDLIQRRVIYLKKSAELKQSSSRGLFTSITDNVVRKNFPLWVVSEDLIALRGFQLDTTSPLDSDPGRLREVVFNDDATSTVPGTKTEPLPLVLLSPEKIHLLSPFYVPVSPSFLTSYYPVSGGKVHPVLHNTTDYVRQENDGFRYGFRSYRLGTTSLISSTANNPSQPFYLRGLWSGPDSTASQLSANQCMISMAGVTLQKRPGYSLTDTAMIPSYAGQSLSPIPPTNSRYYGGHNYFPPRYYPDVFTVQAQNGNDSRQESDLYFSGTRIYTTIGNETPDGKRDLSQPIHLLGESRWNYTPTDTSHKTFAWDVDYYYQNKPQNTPCIPTNVAYRTPGSDGPYDPNGTLPSFNNGRYALIHSEPPVDFRAVGAIMGVDQPVLETKARVEP